MFNKIVFKATLALTVVGLIGCALEGMTNPGVSGNEMGYGSEMNSVPGVGGVDAYNSRPTIHTMLFDAADKPMRGVKVVVETPHATDTTGITNEAGESFASLSVLPGEQILFKFFKNGRSIGSRGLKSWKSEDNVIEANFKFDSSGIWVIAK